MRITWWITKATHAQIHACSRLPTPINTHTLARTYKYIILNILPRCSGSVNAPQCSVTLALLVLFILRRSLFVWQCTKLFNIPESVQMRVFSGYLSELSDKLCTERDPSFQATDMKNCATS